jgi:cytidylate kinase
VTTLLVAGLTGSGKTSATKMLAEHLGYQWLSGSDLRRKFLGLNSSDLGASRISQATSQTSVELEQARLRSVVGESRFDDELLCAGVAVASRELSSRFVAGWAKGL